MRTKFILMVPALGFLIGPGCAPVGERASSPTTTRPAAVADGDLRLERVDGGGAFSWQSFRGQDLLLYVWAPWTDAGQAAFDQLLILEAGPVKVLPVVVDRRSAEERAQSPLGIVAGLPPVWADDDVLTRVGGVRALPTTVWLDTAGNVVTSWPGLTRAETVIEAMATRSGKNPRP
ncbi:MAG TPA: hypothetical protein PKE26_08270 [Kiritimatiellia bacterium]|nr:hypothetical protein [Kiritimatiellia bacterium]HMO99089.1 hypothetical protein [Kiritimatiellia bacterium]HMP96620.1 hypothetical protein [Kiritimatiellia bacterium]